MCGRSVVVGHHLGRQFRPSCPPMARYGSCEALPDIGSVDPVADFESRRAKPPMKPQPPATPSPTKMPSTTARTEVVATLRYESGSGRVDSLG